MITPVLLARRWMVTGSVEGRGGGPAFVQNLRRGHYDIATEVPALHRLRLAFDNLAFAI
jgi:hypothetical protein